MASNQLSTTRVASNPHPKRIAAGAFHSIVVSNLEQPAPFVQGRLEQKPPPGRLSIVYGFGTKRNNVVQDAVDEEQESAVNMQNAQAGKTDALPDVFDEPTRIHHFDRLNIHEVAAGGNVTAYLEESGLQVWVTGLGTNGRLGIPRPKNREEAQRLLEDSGYSRQQRERLGYGDHSHKREHVLFEDQLYNADLYPKWTSPAPLKVGFPSAVKVVSITCGTDHSMALTERGMIFVWGLGAFGNLGTGSTDDCYTPTELKFFATNPCKTIAAGSKHSFAVTFDGDLFAWGYGGNGRLGLGPSCDGALSPREVEVFPKVPIECVAAAEAHSSCIDATGNVYCWGAGTFGRTGHGEENDTPTVTKVSRLSGTPCRQVELGTHHSVVLTRGGHIYAWGAGEATGLVEKGGVEITRPKRLHAFDSNEDDPKPSDMIFTQVAAGCFHTLALNQLGEVYSWGIGTDGRLGLGSYANAPLMADHYTPFLLRGQDFKKGSLCEFVGWVDDFELLLKKEVNTLNTTAAPELEDDGRAAITSVQCGGMHSAVVVKENNHKKVWIWGSGEYGQTGLGDGTRDTLKPCSLDGPYQVEMIALGLEHCLMLVGGQTPAVFAWGRNNSGQLGLGNNRDAPLPTQLMGIPHPRMVAAGEDHSAVVLATKDLYTWGAAEFGKLGHGSGSTSGTQNYPRCVRSEEQFLSVACGGQHTAMLNDSRQLITCGAGWYGRLGHGNMDNCYSPKLVESVAMRKFKEIQCGSFHTCMVDDSDRLWVCGRDWTVCRPDHVQIPTLMYKDHKEIHVRLLAVGAMHTIVVTTDGKMLGWGDNRHHQLGDIGDDGRGRLEFPREIVLSKSLPHSEITMIATGSSHTLACLRDGDLKAWGLRTGGRLGIGNKKVFDEAGEGRKDHSAHHFGKHCPFPVSVEAFWLEDDERDRMKRKQEAKSIEDTTATHHKEEPADEKRVKMSLFGILQKKLKDEPLSNSVPELRKAETRLEDQYREFIGDIFCLWDQPKRQPEDMEEPPGTEWTLRQLQNKLERSLCRNLKSMGLGDNYSTIQTPVHPDIAAKLGNYEELLWVLQQHPCYLSRLAQCLSVVEETELGERERRISVPPSLFMDVVSGIFARLRDSRTRRLFMSLLRLQIRQEIKIHDKSQNKDAHTLFDAKNSRVVHMVKFFVEHKHFSDIHSNMFDPDKPGSLMSIILDWTIPEKGTLDDTAKPREAHEIPHFCFAMTDEDLLQQQPPEVHLSDENRQEILANMADEFQAHQLNFFSFLGRLARSDEFAEAQAHHAEAAAHQGRSGAQNRKKGKLKVRKTFTDWMCDLQPQGDLSSIFACIKDFMDDTMDDEERFMKRVEFEAQMKSGSTTEQSDVERIVFRPILMLLVNSIIGHLLENWHKVMSKQMLASAMRKIKERLLEKSKDKNGTQDAKQAKLTEKQIEKETNEVMNKLTFNVKQLGIFMNRALRQDFGPAQAVLKEHGSRLISDLCFDVVEKLLDGAEDETEAGLTLDLYQSHYTLPEIVVSLRTDTLLQLSNALWWFQDQVVALKRSMFMEDRLFQTVDAIQPEVTQYSGDRIKDPRIKSATAKDMESLGSDVKVYKMARLWPHFISIIAEQTAIAHNFTIKARFLEHHRDLTFCRDCQAPILRSMCPLAQRGRKDLRLIRKYLPDRGEEIEGTYPFDTIIQMLSMPSNVLPNLKSQDWISLKYELQDIQKAAYDRISRGSKANAQKDLSLIAELAKAKEACELVRTYGKQTSALVRLVYCSLEDRQELNRYHEAIEDHREQIVRAQKFYKDQLKDMIANLNNIVHVSEEARLPDVLVRKAEQSGVSLKLAKVEKANRRAQAAQPKHQAYAVLLPSATLSLGFLRSKQIVAWIQQDFPHNQYKRISFSFSAQESGDWEVVVLHKEHRSTNALFSFTITVQEIDRMRGAGKTAKVSYQNGWAVMNAFNLLQLLARITADAC